jgi:cobalt-zinc-cadmium efflux system membrane fusion protein
MDTPPPRLRAPLLAALLSLASACAPHGEHGDHEGEGHESEGHEAHAEGDDHEEGDDHDDHEESELVVLSESALARSGVRLGPVERGALGEVIEAPAEVQLNPDRVAHISPLVDGQVVDVAATIGDRVAADEELAVLRSVALGQARADLDRAEALRTVAQQTLERQERLRNEGINSERALLEAQAVFDEADAERDAARSRLRVFGVRGGAGPDVALASPIAGLVLERHATRGETVTPDDVLFVVADLASVWVIGQVYEQDIGRVRAGMPATLHLPAYPGQTWAGSVDLVGAAVDPATRTLPVRVVLENTDGRLIPGLFGALSLALDTPAEGDAAPPPLLVPQAAVRHLGERAVVFVPADGAAPDEAPGAFEPRTVTLGRAASGRVEVLEGLAPDTQIVVEGAFVLESELRRGQLGHGHAH